MLALARRMKVDDGVVPRAWRPARGRRKRNTAECDSWRGLTAARAWTSAVAAVTSQPARSSRAALRRPRDGQRLSDVGGHDRDRDRHRNIVGAPPQLGRDLRCSDRRIDRIGQSALEVRADRSPGPPAAPARHSQPHRVAPLEPGGRPPRHTFMIT